MKYLFLPVLTATLVLGAGCQPGTRLSVPPMPAPPAQLPSVQVEPVVIQATTTEKSVKPLSTYSTFTKEPYTNAVIAGKPVMLFFYASWCPYCQKQDPIIENVYAEQKEDLGVDTFRVHYADSQTTDAEKAFAKAFGVSSQHTFILLGKDGKEVARSVGPMTAEQVRLFLAKAK